MGLQQHGARQLRPPGPPGHLAVPDLGTMLTIADLTDYGQAVEVLGGSTLKVDGLECARCYSPALTWACDAKVNATGLAIKEGTPAEQSPPSGCGA